MKYLLLIFLALFFISSLQGAPQDKLSCDKRLFTLKVSSDNEKVTILNILKNISGSCNISIFMKDKSVLAHLNKPIKSINFEDKTFLEFLDILLTKNNIYFKFNNKILDLYYLRTISFNLAYLNKDNTKFSKTLWKNIKENLDEIVKFNGGKSLVTVNSEAGLVTVNGTQQDVNKIGNYLTRLESSLHRQVYLNIKIIDFKYNFVTDDRISISDLKLKYDKSSSKNKYQDFISFLNTKGSVNNISNSKILALNNRLSNISIGKKFKNNKIVGLNLKIRPNIDDLGNIVLSFDASVSSYLNSSIKDEIYKSSISTVVTFKDGYSVLVGGIDIKKLFSSKLIEDHEILFIITPKISNDESLIYDLNNIDPRYGSSFSLLLKNKDKKKGYKSYNDYEF